MEKESQLFFFSGFLIATLLFGCFVFKRHYLFICVLCTRSVFVCTTGLDFFFFFFFGIQLIALKVLLFSVLVWLCAFMCLYVVIIVCVCVCTQS